MLHNEHLKCNVLKRVAVATITKEKRKRKKQQKQNRKQNVQWQICHVYL